MRTYNIQQFCEFYFNPIALINNNNCVYSHIIDCASSNTILHSNAKWLKTDLSKPFCHLISQFININMLIKYIKVFSGSNFQIFKTALQLIH